MVSCPFLYDAIGEQKLIFLLNISKNQYNYYGYQYNNCRAEVMCGIHIDGGGRTLTCRGTAHPARLLVQSYKAAVPEDWLCLWAWMFSIHTEDTVEQG